MQLSQVSPIVIQSVFDDPHTAFIYILTLCHKTGIDVATVTNLLLAGETAILLSRCRPGPPADSRKHLPKV